MRNIFYKILPFCLGTTFLVGCENETKYNPLAEPVPLTMSINDKAFVMGERLIVDIKVNPDADGNMVAANEEFDIYFTAKSGTSDFSNVFEPFHKVVIFPKGEKQIQVEFPIKETGLDGSVNFDFTAFARGYKIADFNKSIKVSDYYRISLAIEGNSENVVTEGDNFVLVASLDKPRAIPIVVKIDTEDTDYFDSSLPSELYIPAGASSVKSGPIAIVMDGEKTGDKELTLKLSTNSETNPMKSDQLVITMTDLESMSNPDLYDPTLVYPTPEYPFVSAKNKGGFDAWWGDKGQTDIAVGDAHTNADLAADGWKFWYAVEYHFLASSFAWNMPPPNEFGNRKHWAFNDIVTKSMQTVFAYNREKCANVTEQDGTLKMWVQAGSTPIVGGGENRDYAAAGLSVGQGGPGMASRIVHINPGMRVEMRVRITGDRTGIVPTVELINAVRNVYDVGQKIKILENPKGNLVTQKVFSTIEDGIKTSPIPKIGDWNIYWAEITTDGIKVGINGSTNVIATKTSTWDYAPADGMALNMYFAPLENAPVGWDATLKSISDPKKDARTPTMEVDWIRFYTNDTYSDQGVTYWGNRNGNLFY